MSDEERRMKKEGTGSNQRKGNPFSSFTLHPSSRFSLLCLAACFLCIACSSAPPRRPPGRPRIQAEQAESAARAAYQRQNWASAAESFGRAAEAFAAIDDHEAEATARQNQGQALRRMGQLEPAIAAYEKSLALNRRLKRPIDQAQNLDGLAQCYRAQNKLDQAIQTGQDALKLAGNARMVTGVLQNDLALTLLQRGNPADQERIIGLFKSALESSQSSGNNRALAANHLNLGRAYLHFGQLDPSEVQLKKALELFRSVDDPLGLAHTHELLARLYSQRNDTETARFHLNEARAKFEFLKDQEGLRRVEQQLKP